jgi:dihydropteroate synthase
MVYNFGKVKYDFSIRSYIMGILNITPDSFSDGGKFFDDSVKLDEVLRVAKEMEKDGADFIDVGGESTRPGAEPVPLDEELNRVIPVIETLSKQITIPISIDTYKSKVAEEALKAGAVIVNDISGFNFDSEMPEVVHRYNASCILMHIKGQPKNMQVNPEYKNVISEIYEYLSNSINIAKNYGINQIIIDVGFGFGKTLENNIELLTHLNKFKRLGYPILVGLSNKSFIDKIYPVPINERLSPTIAANIIALINGANIIRVHNVLENKKALRIFDRVCKGYSYNI